MPYHIVNWHSRHVITHIDPKERNTIGTFVRQPLEINDPAHDLNFNNLWRDLVSPTGLHGLRLPKIPSHGGV